MSVLRLDDFQYELPPELIAQSPLPERHDSRLMLLDRSRDTVTHHRFREFPELLESSDLVVANDTLVFPARLLGQRMPGGGRAELLLVREKSGNEWECICRPAKRLRQGTRLSFGGGRLIAEILQSDILPPGRVLCRLEYEGDLDSLLEETGEPPLPPYIQRDRGDPRFETDRNRYQTVYARTRGSIAAPTAGLHFTTDVLDELNRRKVGFRNITLHVGPGTFIPVRVEEIRQHRMEAESFRIPGATARAVEQAKREDRRVIAVGTTTTRALEFAWSPEAGHFGRHEGEADLFIHPGYRFSCINGLLTNFHLPGSTLLMLVSALAGRERVLEAYRQAVTEGYRFYSYGDCMLIL